MVKRQTEEEQEAYDLFDANWNSAEDRTEVQVRFHESGEYVVRGMIKSEGHWLRLSEPITITVGTREILEAPTIQIDEENLKAGQDVIVSYSLDNRAESASYVLYKETNGNYHRMIFNGTLTSSESTIILDGASLFAGDYKIVLECSAPDYSPSSSFSLFSLKGERAAGPSVNVSTYSTYVNTDILFEAEQSGATFLRIQYSTDSSGQGDAYSREIASGTGVFSWKDACTEFETDYSSISWYVRVMARIDGIWTDWSIPSIINIESKGCLETPSFSKAPENIESGKQLRVVVSVTTWNGSGGCLLTGLTSGSTSISPTGPLVSATSTPAAVRMCSRTK